MIKVYHYCFSPAFFLPKPTYKVVLPISVTVLPMETTRTLFGTPLPNCLVPWQDSTSVKNGEGGGY